MIIDHIIYLLANPYWIPSNNNIKDKQGTMKYCYQAINSNQLAIKLITIIHNYLSEYMYLKWFVRLSSTITSISHANIFEFFFCFCTLIFWADINTNELIMIDAMVTTSNNDIFWWNGLNRLVSPIFVWQDDEIMVHLRLYLSPEIIFMHAFKIFTTFLFDTIFHRLTS